MVPTIVIDTNVLVAALRSQRGASFRLLSEVGRGLFEISLSVPLVVEYEAVAKRYSRQFGLTHSETDDIVDYLCRVGQHHRVHFLWRPFLRDPGDDLVLEIAVEANCEYIVTHNTKHFKGAERFGLLVTTPQQFLRRIEVIR